MLAIVDYRRRRPLSARSLSDLFRRPDRDAGPLTGSARRPCSTGASTMGVYERGGTVVTAATTDWAHGLRKPDPIVDRITRNILDRLSR